MKIWIRLIAFAIACLIINSAQNVGIAASTADIPPGELIMVRPHDGATLSAATVLSALDRAVAVPALDVPELGIQVYRTPGRSAVLPRQVETLPGVKWASKVAVWQLDPLETQPSRTAWEPMAQQAVGPPDREPLFSLQWGMEAIGDIRGAWQIATGYRVLVGVIDTGIDCAHPDIRCTREVNHYDAIRRIEVYQSSVATQVVHGTHVAGIIAGAHNNRGTVGVAPEAEILGCRACSDGGRCSELDLAACIGYLAPRGVSVINMSLGGTYSPYTPALCEGISWASAQHGVLSVASVGNAGPSRTPLYPATCGGVMGVAASVKPYGSTLADYSQRASVDITAPGSEILSAIPGSRWAYLSGTSMAAPHVSGAAALLAESMGAGWNPAAAAQMLGEYYARRICGSSYQISQCGWGALDVNAALRGLTPAPPPDEDPTATPWWGTDEPETPTAEPTPTVEPTATDIPAVKTALAELTQTAAPPSPSVTPSEAPTASATDSPTERATSSATASATMPPTSTPTITPTLDAVALTVTALWPTQTPDVWATITAKAPTPDRVATSVWATLNAPGAVATRAAEATMRAKGRHGPQFFPALLRVLPEPPPGPTDSCRDVLYPWACPQRTRDAMATREVEGTATAVAAATQTAVAPTPTPGRTWPEDDPRSGYRTITIYQQWAPGQVATMQAEDRAIRLGLPLLRKEIR